MHWEVKREFLKRVIDECVFKSEKSRMALQTILDDCGSLQNIHFVENAHYFTNGLKITLVGVFGPPFRYFNGNYVTDNENNFINVLKLNKKEKLYVEIVMSDNLQEFLRYESVHEDIPHVPSVPKTESPVVKKNMVEVTIKRTKEVDIPFTMKLQEALQASRILDQLDEIDAALDANDAESFAKLTEDLKLLNGGTPYAFNTTTS